MRRACLLLVLLWGCAAPPDPGASSAGLSAAGRWSDDAPEWIADAETIDAAGSLTLLALEAPRGPEQSDARPARPIVAARDGRYLMPPSPALAARVVADRVAWVTLEGALILDDGERTRTLDLDAVPELDVAPDGRTLAWAERPGPDAGVRVVDASDPDAQPRLVTPGMQIADRPRFVDAATLVVVGSSSAGVAGVWSVRWSARDPRPVALTNGALRVGQPFGGVLAPEVPYGSAPGAPLGASFVPPPADHASMRVEDGALVYHDGVSTQRVALTEVSR